MRTPLTGASDAITIFDQYLALSQEYLKTFSDL